MILVKYKYLIILAIPMGKSELQMYIELSDMNTGAKIIQKISNPRVSHSVILDLIQSYMPQIDLDSVTIYYYKYNKWQLFLQGQQQDLQYFSHCFERDNKSNEIVLQVRYHCEYFLENQQQQIICQEISSMNEKVMSVQKLYQQLREKYMEDVLDINVFWGSPIFTEDQIVRSKKEMQTFQNMKGETLQLLRNQLKYAPYINAITSALQGSDKKVRLRLKAFNEDSFTRKSVFTVTYIMAHLEVEEVRERDHHKSKKNKDFSKTVHVKHHSSDTSNLRKIHSEKIKQPEPVLNLPKLDKDEKSEQDNFEMVITQSESHPESVKTLPKPREESVDFKLSHAKSDLNSFDKEKIRVEKEKEKEKEKGMEIPQLQQQNEQEQQIVSESTKNFKKKNETTRKKKGPERHGRRLPRFNHYLLGERVDGGLAKITPNKLSEMLTENIREIELLILHTSYPYHHLQAFSKKAKNIILINSNPLFPQPSTIFFVKHFFTQLLKTGNIAQSYNQALAYITSIEHKIVQNELEAKQVEYINQIKQKYVHGTIQCCCCYHPHHQNCHSNFNNMPTKYAEYHYKFHTMNCECPRQHLMMHSCEEKRNMMKKFFQVLDKHADVDRYYFCCCTGYELGYYRNLKKNKECENLCLINEERDRHSLRYKYRYEKRMMNEEENQLEIYSGKVQGDVGKNLIDAFKFKEDNGLIGNRSVLANLLQIFAESFGQRSIVCNLFGAKRTGRKTIAVHFAHLLIIKQLFGRMVVKRVSSGDSIGGIVRKEMERSEEEGLPFFIFIIVERGYGEELELSQPIFGEPVSAIVITDKKVRVNGTLSVTYLQPMPFKTQHCLAFVKMYKHLSRPRKRDLQRLFKLADNGYDKEDIYELYPCSLNKFQILSTVQKTCFNGYEMFQQSLTRLRNQYAYFYLFVMSIIKFTTSTSGQRQQNLFRVRKFLQKMEGEESLFFKDYDCNEKPDLKDSTELSFATGVSNDSKEKHDQKEYLFELTSFQRLRQHYYLIYACAGYKFKKDLVKVLKLFINYSTLVPNHRFSEDPKMKRQINYIRIKNSPFAEQVYEATTISPSSFLARYFKDDIAEICQEFSVQGGEKGDLQVLQDFLRMHARQLQFKQRLANKKSLNDSYSKPKDKRTPENYHANQCDSEKGSSGQYDHSECHQQSTDIPNVYHLSGVMEAGLQFVRAIVGNHFIYHRLKEEQRIEFLKFSLLLLNNCVILMKNKTFAKMSGHFDIDDECDQLGSPPNMMKKMFDHTHSQITLGLQTMKSHDGEVMPPPSTHRSYSGRDLFNSKYQTIERNAVKSNKSEREEGRRSFGEKADELLLKQLYRLSTYRGVLYLLSQLERRVDEISNESVDRIKIGVQLLGIQVRLQLLQVDREEVKLIISEKDNGHLSRISQVLGQKNYNMIALKKILREMSGAKSPIEAEQLGVIKSHVVVALALMSSYYGRYKLVRGNFMIQQIDDFLNDWNATASLQRKQSQTEGVVIDREQLSRMCRSNPFFGFIRLISESESVYLHIVQCFNSQKFWQETKRNQQLQIYQYMLRLFHWFTLKNTKSKGDFYSKLEYIESRLGELRKIKHFCNCSTYIHNFRASFVTAVKNEMNKLGDHLIMILTGDGEKNENDIKMSISQKLQGLLTRKASQTEYFCVKKKFNMANLHRMGKGYKCNYLCIWASSGSVNEKLICVENEDGKGLQEPRRVVEMLSRVKYKVAFVCMPKKKNLVQLLVATNPMKRIIYFDFAHDNFNYAEQRFGRDLLIFEKMIMIKTVAAIMEGIIDRQKQQSKTAVTQSFSRVGGSLSFVLVDEQNRELIRLSNKQFRKRLFMEGMENGSELQYPQKKIKFHQNQRIKDTHLGIIEKFTGRLGSKGGEEVRVDLPANKEQFLEVFMFCFREKYGFDHIFRINLEEVRELPRNHKGKGNENVSGIMKLFYEKLAEKKVLQHIFSNRKVIFMLQFKQRIEGSQKILQQIMRGFDEQSCARRMHKFVGCPQDKKNVPQVIIYFFDYHDREQIQDFQYMSN